MKARHQSLLERGERARDTETEQSLAAVSW